MLTHAACRRPVAAARAWRSQGDSSHTHTSRPPRLNWPPLRARPGPQFTCFTALLVLVPRVAGEGRQEGVGLYSVYLLYCVTSLLALLLYLNWPPLRARAGPQFTCFTALLVLLLVPRVAGEGRQEGVGLYSVYLLYCVTSLLVPRVAGVARVYCGLCNPNASDGRRVSACTQFTCFTALLVLGPQFSSCSSGTRMRGTEGECLLLLALPPLSVRCKPPPSPGTQFYLPY